MNTISFMSTEGAVCTIISIPILVSYQPLKFYYTCVRSRSRECACVGVSVCVCVRASAHPHYPSVSLRGPTCGIGLHDG
ncbi:hypothetical protein EVAR_81378_1 [Eumeta japonica]|uniref:Uncharacterized protein n=1 Tax=Eumeta variegata TaxID=151549 RepID=A0A4C1WHB9_EUMVA|nr:hypothetical protein EVAR_81378_1 [Eumeta japonica]